MALPPSGSGVATSPDEEHRTLALSLIRLRGYQAPAAALLDEIIRDALALADADDDRSATPTGPAILDHLDCVVRVAAAAGRLQRV